MSNYKMKIKSTNFNGSKLQSCRLKVFKRKMTHISTKGKGILFIFSLLTIWVIYPDTFEVVPVEGYTGSYSDDFTSSTYKDLANTNVTGWEETYDSHIPGSGHLNLSGYVYVNQVLCDAINQYGSWAGIFVEFYSQSFSSIARIYYEFAASGQDSDFNWPYKIKVYNQTGNWLNFNRDVFQDYIDQHGGNPYEVEQIGIVFCVFARDGGDFGDRGVSEAYFDDWTLRGHSVANGDFELGATGDWELIYFDQGYDYLYEVNQDNPHSDQSSYYIYTESYRIGADSENERNCHIYVGQNVTLNTNNNFITLPRKTPELIGAFNTPNNAKDVVVEGNYAYVADDNQVGGIQVIDISDPKNPSLAGCYNANETAYNGIDVAGDYAYVATDLLGILVLNITDPSTPEYITNVAVPGEPQKVIAMGTELFIASKADPTGQGNGSHIVDISIPTTPQLTDSYSTSGNAMDVCVPASYFILNADTLDGLIRSWGSANNSAMGAAYGLDFKGDHAFVSGENGFYIININNQYQFSVVGKYLTTDTATHVSVYGDYAYVTLGYSGLEVINIRDLKNPYSVGMYNTPGKCQRVKIVGSHAFLAAGGDGLQILAINEIVSPSLAASYDSSNALDLTLDGDYAYFIDAIDGRYVINISDPTSPSYVTNYPVYDGPPAEPCCIAVMHNFVYIGYYQQSDLISFDITNIYDWTMIGYNSPPGNDIYSYENFVFGRYLYQANKRGGLQCYNSSTPWAGSPQSLGSYDIGEIDLYGVFVTGTYAYLAYSHMGLYILNIANWQVNPQNKTNELPPRLLGSVDIGSPGIATKVFVSGDIAYIAAQTEGLKIVNVSDPTNPFVITSYDTPGVAVDVFVQGDCAFVADGPYGLYVIDISVPSNPTLIGSYDTSGEANSVIVEGDYAYVADKGGGLQIIEVSQNLGQKFKSFASAQSTLVHDSGSSQLFSTATLNPFDYVPSGTSITYELSPDNGVHWEQVTPGVEHIFSNEGHQLLWRANLTTTDDLTTPVIFDIRIDYDTNLMQPSLISPADAFTYDNNTPSFEWGFVTNATSYLFQLDTSTNFNTLNLINETVTGLAYTHSSPLTEDTWYWRVAGIDSTDDLGDFSEIHSFQIILAPPQLGSPKDFSLNAGERVSIIWGVIDNYPSNYTVYRNGSIHQQGVWTSSVLVWLDTLEVGVHEFTCVVENIFGKTDSDDVIITILPALPDTTPPNITSPENIVFEEGSIGYSIIWKGSDDRSPWWVKIRKDGSLIIDKGWLGEDIEVSLDGLTQGLYEYNCTLLDQEGNSVSDIVMVSVTEAVPDTEPPEIVPPSPMEYEEGSINHYLYWICTDDHPFAYSMIINGTEIEYGPWHGENLNQSADGLDRGIWEFKLIIWDLSQHNDTETVLVTVVPDTTPPEVSQPADLLIAENMFGSIIWEVFDDNPSNYEIVRNQTLTVSSGPWMSGILQYSFTSLPIGSWEFTLTVWDQSNLAATSTVNVKVIPLSSYDTSPPLISHLPDRQITFGTTGNILTCHLFDDHPQIYRIYLDDVQVLETLWTIPNVEVDFSLDGLSIGQFEFKIVAWDLFDNSATQSATITILGDITSPTISSPPDIVASEGHYDDISWEVYDETPHRYEIISLPDGDIIEEGPWSNNLIELDVSNFTEGIYMVRCIVYDASGNFAFDDVKITIRTSESAPSFNFLIVVPVLFILIMIRRDFFENKRRRTK
ncbi:MAG: LVIVD repeat-containing protein [Promethearchaeota archaeon]